MKSDIDGMDGVPRTPRLSHTEYTRIWRDKNREHDREYQREYRRKYRAEGRDRIVNLRKQKLSAGAVQTRPHQEGKH